MARKVPVSEIVRHDKPDDLWIVVDGKVYDMTDFAPQHPGGADIIYRYAGQDASREYGEIHAPSLISSTLEPEKHVGLLDEASVTDAWKTTTAPVQAAGSGSGSGTSANTADAGRPPLSSIINLYDFEKVASRTLSRKSWAYIQTGSNDNITRDANDALLKRVWLRPAVMRDVRTVNTRARLFGCDLAAPVYIAPTGAARTGGPEGELAMAAGAAAAGFGYCVSTVASYPYAEILGAAPADYGGFFFQLYVNRDRPKTEEAVRRVTASGRVKAIWVTVDLPVVSKREADERVKLDDAPAVNANTGVRTGGGDAKGGGLARQTGSFIDPAFTWDDLPWLRSLTHLPIVVKGVQRAEDAREALRRGCQGIVVSNHGGRAADYAPPAILTLLELHRSCPEVFGAMEVLVDGGFRRGADVVKAICLGASAVGFGRSFICSVNYGREGVEHAAWIIQDEIETAMRLCGITDLMRDASPEYVNTADIDHLVPGAAHPYARKVIRDKARL